MSEHCLHCGGWCGNGLTRNWDHHCYIEGAGYIKWNDGKCPLCSAALTERAAIVAWLSTGCAADWWMAPDFAEAIERGDHLGGDDE